MRLLAKSQNLDFEVPRIVVTNLFISWCDESRAPALADWRRQATLYIFVDDVDI